jgi:hypothetical protein
VRRRCQRARLRGARGRRQWGGGYRTWRTRCEGRGDAQLTMCGYDGGRASCVMCATVETDDSASDRAHARSDAQRCRKHVSIVCATVDAAQCVRGDGWCRVNGRLDLSRLLLSLFAPSASASVEEVSDHTARCLIGAFTQAECMATIRTLRIKDLKDGRSAFHQLRLLCLDHIEKFYSKLKICV